MTPGPEGYGPEMRRLLEMARVYGAGSDEFVRKIEKRRKAEPLTDDESAALYLQEHGVRFANDALVGWPVRSPPAERVLQRAVFVVVRRWDLQARARWIKHLTNQRLAGFEERYRQAVQQVPEETRAMLLKGEFPNVPDDKPEPRPWWRRLFGR